MVCSSGTYTFSGDGQKCVGYKTLLVGVELQISTVEMRQMRHWQVVGAPTPLPCATSGTYTLRAMKHLFWCKTEIFRSGTANQYCGNKIYTKTQETRGLQAQVVVMLFQQP